MNRIWVAKAFSLMIPNTLGEEHHVRGVVFARGAMKLIYEVDAYLREGNDPKLSRVMSKTSYWAVDSE